jgi:diguanylate cyclase (GGDEF)-like protein/PAS domain S-box-containing protein
MLLAVIQLLASAALAPLNTRVIEHFVPVHTLMETLSIIVAMMVFAQGWNARVRQTPGNLTLLASAFFVVGWLDFSHALSYVGMPDFLSPNDSEKQLAFWLSARLLAALALLIVSVRPWQRPFGTAQRYAIFGGLCLVSLIVHWVVIQHQAWLPRFFVPGVGLTPLKKGLEYFVVAINLVTAVFLWRRMRQPLPFNAALLLGAVGAMAMSDLFFTLYTTMNDTHNVLGHVYKVVSYLFIYRAVVVESIERPYRELEAAQQNLELAVRASNTGLWYWDLRTHQVSYSAGWKSQLGYREDELANGFSTWEALLHPEDSEGARQRTAAFLVSEAGLTYENEFRLRHKDGSYHWILARGEKQFDIRGKAVRVLGSHTDLTERRRAEDRIRQLVYFDLLTGLPNRSLLNERVTQSIAQAQRENGRTALLFVDLDHFKHVNDTLGHRVGDELLIAVAQRLTQALRGSDTVARIGGDEFVIVLPASDRVAAAGTATKIMTLLSQPCPIGVHELTVTPSIGIAMYPEDGADFDALYQHADTAMYRAKQDGRNGFSFFTKEMQSHTERMLTLENAMHQALDREQFYLVYQPQLSMDGARVVGVEALLRWQHPELGLISPGEFIPLAESNGQIIPIGSWVLSTAVNQLRAWLDDGLAPMVMAVNISAVQFRHPNLPTLVTSLLETCALKPEYLELELTEGVAMRNPRQAIAVMDELHALGVRLSIDDFGTGYSSLNHLKRFNIYKLKIDQSFVRDIATDADDRAIVKAIIHLAASLGFRTVAEGVETTEQHHFLAQQGCDEVQGYLFSRPLMADHLYAFVKQVEAAALARPSAAAQA